MTSGQVQQSPVQTNVSNILSPTLYSVGGWPSSSGPTASSIQAQENVHVSSNLQVPNQQNKPSEGAASNILDIQQRFSGSTSAELHVATSKCDGAAGDVQAANSQPNEISNSSIVPCHEPDSDNRDLEARDGSASESKSKSVDGGKLDLSSSLPTVSGSLGLPDASVPAQISEASSSSQPQPESQRLVPVSAQQVPAGGVNPVVNTAPPLNLGWGVSGQNPSLGTGTAQVIGNMVYGPAVQGAANMGVGE
ncbi:zinc finger CCCH domain-containing protein 19-like [Iris pallida]|uniref:Zinc finger CCCH domain-containing protein 19-like n=1 Tax=Iris pallida TaxID=29817 RepID=A0AAX6GSE2_IRIPA|nr:zinc finger CCCH domain-containing protein 19-like [Iris pallida]